MCVYDYAVERYVSHSDPFVLWGTCQGFQCSCTAVAQDISVVENGFVGVEWTMLPLEMSEEVVMDEEAKVRLLGPHLTPLHVATAVRQSPSTLNVHRWGVSPTVFATNAKLSAAFHVLATNVDAKGRRFVSLIEHKGGVPIFAAQFHPEWPPYDFSNDRAWNRQRRASPYLPGLRSSYECN